MPLEAGGRADKEGNRYENDCKIFELLNILKEKNSSIVIEPIGADEAATDILVTTKEGMKEHQQCKERNSSEDSWRISDLKSHGIINKWKMQLGRDNMKRNVSLKSPIGCSFLVDLHQRAMNTNGNANDFWNVQIKGSSAKFVNFAKNLSKELDLDILKENDLNTFVSFLQRIFLKQMSEYEIHEFIFQDIQFYFVSDSNTVYNALLKLVVAEDIWGHEITLPVLMDFIKQQNLVLRLMDGDSRVLPKLEALNEEYLTSYKPLKDGLIQRPEFSECIQIIRNNQSFIISGNAGCGKSGCTQAIINYCQGEKIPYVAIKLDRRVPHSNCENWGKEMGLSGSISYALHSVSHSMQAVIILDQLDALRWTQSNSCEAISVCMELIKQVEHLNANRERKIIIVFVCREYDLKNDNNIASLFKTGDDSRKEIWRKVIVRNFDESIVKNIVGKKYEQLTVKTRRLLQIPSNLYIWQHLSEEQFYGDCTTTSHLIEKWYQQICKKCKSVGVTESAVKDTKNRIVAALDRKGCLYIPKSVLDVEEDGLDYLVSAEMVACEKSKIGFVHQSILDYFISERMMKQYYDDETIENIIGGKDKQTPGKRYQIQMFMQNLLESDSRDFLKVGKRMLASDGIRYYVKFLFYEILAQITEPDRNIEEFLKEHFIHENIDYHLLNNVVYGHGGYIAILRENGLFEKWFQDESRKDIVFNLLASISPYLVSQDIHFIKKYVFINEEDDKKFLRCFYRIEEDSNEMFELRMMFFEKYPQWAEKTSVDIGTLIKGHEDRAIRLISFCLKNDKIEKDKLNIFHCEELLSEKETFQINDGRYVLDELLQYIPEGDSWEIKEGVWSGRDKYQISFERIVVEVIKKATLSVIEKEPEIFWKYYEPYIGKNNVIYNEIILFCLCFMPVKCSAQVINYIGNQIGENILDYTSGADDKLGLVKAVLKSHAGSCSIMHLRKLEYSISRYLSPWAVEWYKERIDTNQTKEYEPVYWSFWGDLQYQLLQVIPNERLSREGQELLKVLNRKFVGNSKRYISPGIHSGVVYSPISGKTISRKQWLQIITNQKLINRGRHEKTKEVSGGFIESSIEMFAHDFSSAVREHPETMIHLVLENKEKIHPIFIDSLYSGVGVSEHITEVTQQTLEEMFKAFPIEMEEQKIIHFCEILEKTEIYTWSTEISEKLKEIAGYYRKDHLKDKEDVSKLSCEKLYSRALNDVRCHLARVVGHLIKGKTEWFMEFKDLIEDLTLNRNPAVRMDSLFAVLPAYTADRKWTEQKLLYLYDLDIRILSRFDSREKLIYLYKSYREQVISLVIKCFQADDKELIQNGGHVLCELYIRYDEFKDVMADSDNMSEEQLKAVIEMAVPYLKIDQFRDKAKEIILKNKGTKKNLEFPLARIFFDKCIDLERDSIFLQELMKSNVSRRLVHHFIQYMEENAYSLIDYSDIIIVLCESVLGENRDFFANQWGLEEDISKLITALYDECMAAEQAGQKFIEEKCLDLWDIMFEKQIGRIRELSRKLMER